jgi:diguanylate cyclase (GGDEF)-like protein
MTVRQRLLLNSLIGVAIVAGVSVSAWYGLNRLGDPSDRQGRLAAARSSQQDADMMHDALHADVLLSLLVGPTSATRRAEVSRQTGEDAARLERDLTELANLGLDQRDAPSLHAVGEQFSAYAGEAEAMVAGAAIDAGAARARLPRFERLFRAAEGGGDGLTRELTASLATAVADAQADSRSFRTQILVSAFVGALTLLLFAGLLARSIVRRLEALGAAAQRIVAGDLAARAEPHGGDEIAELSDNVNAMADSLVGVLGRLEDEAARDRFGSQLSEALEVADEERAVLAVVERAMTTIAPTAPMELLLSDSSRSHMRAAASSPAAGPPGCPVESPFNCVAVRRGHPVVFETGEALNACPKLRGRLGGDCSAVCAPVTFMGRAIGVLHATAPAGEVASPEQVAELAILANQAGARIGTVRAFAKTQLQASTDSLTGLVNRRTMENRARPLLRDGRPFALAMCDLDRFKALNDTHGHEAGDQALRLFADVLRGAVRTGDIVARQGGEEFVVVFPETDASGAAVILERVRTQLVEAVRGTKQPAFTASFGVTDSSRGRSLEDLLRLADAGLYAAKAAGRDRVVVADPEQIAPVRPMPRAHHVFDEDLDAASDEIRLGMWEMLNEEDPRPSGVEIR